jgi:hypothetical protein
MIKICKILITLCLLIQAYNNGFPKEITVESVVGKEITIEDTLTLTSQVPVDTINVVGLIQIQNQTMFYPDSISYELLNTDYNVEFNAMGSTDYNNNWSYSATIITGSKPAEIELRITIYGEILAGNDSTCQVKVTRRKINNNPFEDFIVNLKVSNVGAPLPYIRFPYLSAGYPNPVSRYQPIYWEYWFDQDSEIIFTLYDLVGKAKIIKNLGYQKKGIYNFSFIPDYKTSSGLYFLMLSTNSGSTMRSFIIYE